MADQIAEKTPPFPPPKNGEVSVVETKAKAVAAVKMAVRGLYNDLQAIKHAIGERVEIINPDKQSFFEAQIDLDPSIGINKVGLDCIDLFALFRGNAGGYWFGHRIDDIDPTTDDHNTIKFISVRGDNQNDTYTISYTIDDVPYGAPPANYRTITLVAQGDSLRAELRHSSRDAKFINVGERAFFVSQTKDQLELCAKAADQTRTFVSKNLPPNKNYRISPTLIELKHIKK